MGFVVWLGISNADPVAPVIVEEPTPASPGPVGSVGNVMAFAAISAAAIVGIVSDDVDDSIDQAKERVAEAKKEGDLDKLRTALVDLKQLYIDEGQSELANKLQQQIDIINNTVNAATLVPIVATVVSVS